MGVFDALKDFGDRLSKWTIRWIPDHWIVALILTGIVFVAAIIWGEVSYNPLTVIKAWGNGFWVLLTFAMQMCLILLLGYIIAVSKPVDSFLDWLASKPNPDKPWQAIFLMGIVTNVLAFINWGLSIVGAAVFTISLARRQKKLDFRLLLATAYLGLGTIWHAGLSASAPLMVSTEDNFLIKQGLLPGIISTSQTLFSSWNLTMLVFMILFTAAFMAAMHPPKEKTLVLPEDRLDKVKKFEIPEKPKGKLSPAERMEWWPGWNIGVFAAVIIYSLWWFGQKGFAGLNLNSINLLFLGFGALFHWRPVPFMRAAEEGCRRIWGIVIQFPFYAGIFGMLKFTALATKITGIFITVASPRTFPVLSYWAAGILNYFVPSGGSEWVITSPILLEAAQSLGVSNATAVIAYAWGDMATDVIQPFWAIALCEITGIKFREMMGYAIAVFIPYVILVSIALLFIPL
ncbi:MAG: short-chain fatty acid transporter [Candidatus Methanofastidiosia archaeon]